MKIVVLAGGNSTERDVSLISGMGVYNALKKKGHKVILLDVYLGTEAVDPDKAFDLPIDWSEGIKAISEENPDPEAIRAMKNGDKSFFGTNVIEICRRADIVFMALHGANGEDGRIQAAFDLYGIPYTGTDYLSSAVCMDKAVTKQYFNQGGVQTPKAVAVFKESKTLDEDLKNAVEEIGFPMVVKACNGGSSVGVYIIHSAEEVKNAANSAFFYDHKILLEEFIKGRELTCGVIEGKALPIVEIAPVSGFYDYKNKYQAGSTIETCPAQIGEEMTKKVQELSELAFRVLGLKTYARIDVMLREDGEAFCLEANTLPGMTPVSLLPQEAREIGLDYEDLCEHIIKISLAKYE